MLPSGFIANDPPPGPLCPVSVFAETAPSTVAMNEGAGVVLPAPPAPASNVNEVWLPPAQPPPPAT